MALAITGMSAVMVSTYKECGFSLILKLEILSYHRSLSAAAPFSQKKKRVSKCFLRKNVSSVFCLNQWSIQIKTYWISEYFTKITFIYNVKISFTMPLCCTGRKVHCQIIVLFCGMLNIRACFGVIVIYFSKAGRHMRVSWSVLCK